MSVLNFSLLRIFQGYLVICCLIINVLCCLATAILDYHISFRLSTTFLIFFKFFLSCFCLSLTTNVILSWLYVTVNTFFNFLKIPQNNFPSLFYGTFFLIISLKFSLKLRFLPKSSNSFQKRIVIIQKCKYLTICNIFKTNLSY